MARKNEEEFQRYYDRAKKICIVLAVSLTLLFLMLSGVLLRLLGTKEEVYDMAREYVNIIFLGIPFLVFLPTVLRGIEKQGKQPHTAVCNDSFLAVQHCS